MPLLKTYSSVCVANDSIEKIKHDDTISNVEQQASRTFKINLDTVFNNNVFSGIDTFAWRKQ